MPVTTIWGKALRDRLVNEAGQEWLVTETGMLVPSPGGVGIGIGDATLQPQTVAVGNANGLRGIVVASVDTDTAWLIGMDAEGLAGDPLVATRAVGMYGASCLFNSEAGNYLFRLPAGTVPADVEGHRAEWGVTTTINGNLYAFLTVGVKEPVAVEETFTEVLDHEFTSEQTLAVLTSTLIETYTAPTVFSWDCIYSNVGDRSATMSVQPQINRAAAPGWVDVGEPVIMSLTVDAQLMQGSATIVPPNPLPTDQVRLNCLSTLWAHGSRPDPWIMGSTQETTIYINQAGVF